MGFPVFTVRHVIYRPYHIKWPFLDEKNLYFLKNSLMTPFFTQFVLSHVSDSTTSRNIGGTVADPWGANPALATPSKLTMEFDHLGGRNSNDRIVNLCKFMNFFWPPNRSGLRFSPPPTGNP